MLLQAGGAMPPVVAEASADPWSGGGSAEAGGDGLPSSTGAVFDEDDPFAPASDLGPASPAVHRHQERHGGHCGYLSAKVTPLGTRRWMDYAVDHYLAQLT